MLITCISWRPIEQHNEPASSLLGFANFALPELGMRLNDCRIHTRARNGARLVMLPGRSWEQGNQRRFTPFLEFTSGAAWQAFQTAALAALDKKIGSSQPTQ